MDILKSDMPYNCYCGTGEADRFASAYIFDGRHKADPATVKIAIVSDRIVSGFYYNSFEKTLLELFNRNELLGILKDFYDS